MREIIDIYDDNMNRIGSKDRDEAHRDGDWHKSFHCWIVYRDNKGLDWIVVQKRGSGKALFPDYLDVTAAGHYIAGETPQDGPREIREELGIHAKFQDLVPLGVKHEVAKVGNIVNREFVDVFLLVCDSSLSRYPFNPEEVKGLALFRIDDGLDMCAGNKSRIDAQFVTIHHLQMKDEIVQKSSTVGLSDFIPRSDAYLYKILVLAKRFLNGEAHLVI